MRRFIATGTIGLTLTALALAPAVLSAAPATGTAMTTLAKKVVRADAQAKKLVTAARACPATARQRAITTTVRKAQATGTAAGRRHLAAPAAHPYRHPHEAPGGRDDQVLDQGGSARSADPPCRSARHARHSRHSGLGRRRGPGRHRHREPAAPGPRPRRPRLSALLNGAGLPAVIPDVAVGDLLTSPLCAAGGSVCVGLDPQALSSGLTSTVSDRIAGLPLLGSVLTPLLNQVDAALASGDAASLVNVQRVSDTVIRIVPTTGSVLASLVNLLTSTGGLTGVPIGQLTIVR